MGVRCIKPEATQIEYSNISYKRKARKGQIEKTSTERVPDDIIRTKHHGH